MNANDKLKKWINHNYLTKGDRGRWSITTQSIIELRDKCFAIDWEKGATEMQENEFYNQPYEVKKVEKMVPVTEWVPVKQDS